MNATCAYALCIVAYFGATFAIFGAHVAVAFAAFNRALGG